MFKKYSNKVAVAICATLLIIICAQFVSAETPEQKLIKKHNEVVKMQQTAYADLINEEKSTQEYCQGKTAEYNKKKTELHKVAEISRETIKVLNGSFIQPKK